MSIIGFLSIGLLLSILRALADWTYNPNYLFIMLFRLIIYMCSIAYDIITGYIFLIILIHLSYI